MVIITSPPPSTASTLKLSVAHLDDTSEVVSPALWYYISRIILKMCAWLFQYFYRVRQHQKCILL